MATEKQSLIDEIIENARRDRKRLEAVADGLTTGFKRIGESADVESETLDPEVSAAFAEEIAKITDSLSKVNQQLVELVKADAKKRIESAQPTDGRISSKERDAIYDELNEPKKTDEGFN